MASGQPDHTKVTLMKGTDPSGNLVTIALDTNGNMIGIMKGDYQGTLKTLATDADGRLQAKLTDPQNIWGKSNVIGNIELAARLGALSTYERRGDTLWFHDFSTGLGCWNLTAVGTGAAISQVTNPFRTAGYACQFTTPTDLGYDVIIQRQEPVLDLNTNFGLEVWFSLELDMDEFEWYLAIDDATDIYYYQLRYDAVNRNLDVMDNGTGWVTVDSNITHTHATDVFYPLKAVIDQATSSYLRAYFGGKEYDLSAYSPYVELGAGSSVRAILRFTFTGDATANRVGLVDSCIFTVNEPAT